MQGLALKGQNYDSDLSGWKRSHYARLTIFTPFLGAYMSPLLLEKFCPGAKVSEREWEPGPRSHLQNLVTQPLH